MNFTYQGFTQADNRRAFTFWSARTRDDQSSIFSIEVDLPLLSRVRLPVQEVPMFCLQLLNNASLAGIDFLQRFRSYLLVEEDFRPLLLERERRAALKALKKPPRQPVRKPSAHSNVVLGPAFQDR
jgi:hypothetical protein